MKKYFLKINTIFLLVAILLLSGSFCFHDLLGPVFEINEAQAATFSETSNNDLACCVAEENVVNGDSNELAINSNHQISTLPCCTSEAHPTLISSFNQATKIVKVAPAIFFSKYEPAVITFIPTTYHRLATSPPELLALKSTILRI